MQFKDYAVVVTGAGIGIGYAICQAFAEQGANVALIDIDGEVAKQAAQKLNEGIGRDCITPYGIDVADPTAMR
jgi:NAD(P)-dependent dehydrogenase (short-subunit alcohol dehydrogenase family)